MIGVFEIQDETNLNIKHCDANNTSLNRHAYSNGKRNCECQAVLQIENARLYFNDLLKDQFSSVASVVQSSPTLYNPMDPSLSLRVCLNSCPLSW